MHLLKVTFMSKVFSGQMIDSLLYVFIASCSLCPRTNSKPWLEQKKNNVEFISRLKSYKLENIDYSAPEFLHHSQGLESKVRQCNQAVTNASYRVMFISKQSCPQQAHYPKLTLIYQLWIWFFLWFDIFVWLVKHVDILIHITFIHKSIYNKTTQKWS